LFPDNLSATLTATDVRLMNLTLTVRREAMDANTATNKVAMDAAAAAAMAQAEIDDELKPALKNVTMTALKLVKINKTWKTNFRVINETFMLLRKKLSFRAPHIPLS